MHGGFFLRILLSQARRCFSSFLRLELESWCGVSVGVAVFEAANTSPVPSQLVERAPLILPLQVEHRARAPDFEVAVAATGALSWPD